MTHLARPASTMELDSPSSPPEADSKIPPSLTALSSLTSLPSLTKIDFKDLASKDKAFNTLYTSTSGHLDFRDPATLTTLTTALLRTSFSLSLSLPPNRLCPPIPNRASYISFLHHLLDSTSRFYTRDYDPRRSITGLDIGTGASAIYALLALRSRPNWHMCVTDTDPTSFSFAAINLARNSLMTRVTMLQTMPDQPLIPLQSLGTHSLDFVMCNPPFFASEAEMHLSLSGLDKQHAPNSVCTGSASEMVCPGGDMGFVTRIVKESLILRDKVTWYTSLFGKLSSARAITHMLREHGITNWAVRCIGQGPTKRWIVAWSFGSRRPSDELVRGEGVAADMLAFPTRYRIAVPVGMDMKDAVERICEKMEALDADWTWDMASSCGIGTVTQNVWNRQYRRGQKKDQEVKSKTGAGTEDKTIDGVGVQLAFRITVTSNEQEPDTEVVIDWLQGTDVTLWESFCGMLHRDFREGGTRRKIQDGCRSRGGNS